MTATKWLALPALLLLTSPAAAQVGVIETVAGGGPNNLPALEADLAATRAVAFDGSGNFYIATSQNRVYKVDSSGLLTVLAGDGTQFSGFSGDGGVAAQAKLNSPSFGLAVDSNGNVFIPDSLNQRIRKVDARGVIATVAGNGVGGFSGDGGPATSASLRNPSSVTVDSAGNLYIADTLNHRIRRVDAATGVITTVAGNGLNGFSGDGGPATSANINNPVGLIVDAAGNLFIADFFNNRVRRIDGATGVITTAAGNGLAGFGGDGGPATAASLNRPANVALDATGNFYVLDFFNHRVRRVDAAGTITTVAGDGVAGFTGDGGPATSARINFARGLATDAAGNVLIADGGNLRVRRVDGASGIINTVAGNGQFTFAGDGFAATSGSLTFPQGVAVDPAGNLYIADQRNHRIRKVDTSGIITTAAGNGAGGFSGDGGPATGASLSNPIGLAVDGAGNLYITDRTSRIRKVDANGVITTVAGNGTAGFGGDGGAATSASLNDPGGVAVDTAGNLFIADTANRRIRKVDASGVITTVAGNGSNDTSGDGGPATSTGFVSPITVAVNTAGNIFIAENRFFTVRRVDANGVITTVAGINAIAGFSGDGGPAISAKLSNPFGVAVDRAGNLYIADPNNRRIRRVILNLPPVANAGPDQTLIVGESGTFDGSASFDPDGTIENYVWEFGDGSSSSGAVVSHAYAVDGTFTATLSVTDDYGASGSDTALVTVLNPSQALDLLADIVESYNLQQGISNSLDKKLELARDALDAANAGLRQDAANKLQSFINAVEAQRGIELTDAQADELVAFANRIVSVI